MAEAKHGLSSWLHKPKTQEPEPAPAPAAIETEAKDGTSEVTSPLDISLAILRAKETINRISPDKRALVEEIDIEEDDAEFDEKAHWGRRSAASRRKKLKSGRGNKAQQQPNYSIKAFCVSQNKKTGGVVAPAGAPESSLSEETGYVAEGEGMSVAPSGEPADDADTPAKDEQQVKSSDANEENNIGESIAAESAYDNSNTSGASKTESAQWVSDSGAVMLTESAEVMDVENSTEACTDEPSVEIVEMEMSPSLVAVAEITLGRPKRQAAVKAQELNDQQRKQTPSPRTVGGQITKGGAIIDLRTPPRKKSSKKNSSSKRSSTGTTSSQGPVAAGGELKTPVGRKRKLEMDKNTPSPATKMSQKESFFLTEQDKKQLQEIEAVAKLREQVRKTREKDLAFFSGKTALNPFFQAPKAQPKSSSSSNGLSDDAGTNSSGDGADVIEIDEHDSSTPGTQERKRKSRWSKGVVHFPSVQHVLCADVESEEQPPPTTSSLLKIPKKVVNLIPEEIVLLDDENDAMSSSSHKSAQRSLFAASSAHMQEQVHAEATFSDLFWFRQYLDCGATSTEVAAIGDDDEQQHNLRFPVEYESESALIDALVDTYGIKEKRVREILDGLIAAKEKRREKQHNLTLVDRYTPVTASGIVGNREPLHLLSSWLSAWKVGGDERDRRSCFQAELFVFEGDDSDEDELSDLCRLFILEGESGAGKSAAVYACAEELGYNIIEINAGQSRAGRNIVEIAGEATQSTRVLHMGNPADKKKKKTPKKKKQKSVDGSASHLSLVLFEDVDLVFDEDKGFLASLCSIAKHSKCPIVLTCKELPGSFPAAPQRLSQVLSKPSVNEFSAWMLLVAYLEQLPLTHALVETLAQFFKCDIRRSLHFIQTHLPQFESKQRAAKWTWRPQSRATATEVDGPVVVIDVHEDDTEPSVAALPAVVVPGWTHWPARLFDMLSSNLLSELSGCASKPEEDKSTQEKVADAHLIESLSSALDAVSVADMWDQSADPDDDETCFFEREKSHQKALELRMAGLNAFLTPDGIGASVMKTKATATSSSECVKRSLEAALAEERRSSRKPALNTMKSKMELPLSSLGPGKTNARFDLDYMPMISRILNSSASHQQSRRRTSRRNHYLSGVISDMSLLDEIHDFTAFRHHADGDQIVAASPSSSPLPS